MFDMKNNDRKNSHFLHNTMCSVSVPVCVDVALLVVVRGDCQLSLQIVQLYSESQLHLK